MSALSLQQRVVGVAVVGQFDCGHRGRHALGDTVARVRGVDGGNILRHLEGDLEFDDEPLIVGGPHARLAAANRAFMHVAGDRIVQPDHGAHLRRGERDLVARHGAEGLGAAAHELALDGVSLAHVARRELRRQRREALAKLMRVEQPLSRALDARLSLRFAPLHVSPRNMRALPANSLPRAASPSPCMSRTSLPTRSSPSGNG